MRSRRFIIVVTFVAILLAGAFGAFAYDHSKRDTIADGVVVGGVGLGGLDPAAARAKLERELGRPLAQPVVVTFERRRYVLSPRIAHVRPRWDAMVDEALLHSRRGTILARVSREVTGGSVDVRMRAQLTVDRRAVDRFVTDTIRRLDRPPTDAHVSFAGDSLGEVGGVSGVTVDARRLRRAVMRELRTVSGSREIEPVAEKVAPRTTTAQLAKEYPTVITVDRATFTLRLWKDLRVAKQYTVAIGQVGLDTPAGLYRIENKAVDPVWNVPNSAWAGDLAGSAIPPGPSNPLKARWMGIIGGAGIHGTDADYSLGSAASHGCVRMAIPDVIELYDLTPVGTPIYIA
ncbi:L,D-transpeptidase family protein [Conexibacter sp. JD483]|uniref:L,D-transpeptidase family protein n=1 Tax=unclassified Conexibacter TaxID=2627773 RepID=UPI002724221E|nr:MULTISPECIES: L,D-transpeptidase family protein [unclassified Conexibacter]MDO8184511.1 L,D-transpeptidase family protein [Conexibacter sp. CPCC 205706]MDO8197817.1 L,D-transpeptidase family protein [Conexibacter sp. CPCC 205762]MDR9369223.1 L,D-transpeptidase family protein [Conexibacter sp. JD483]